MWTSEPLPPGAVMGRRRSIGSLEEDGRGTAVCAPPDPSPVLAYFQSPDRLVRRRVARAPRLAGDAVPVEAGPGETELVTSAMSSPAAESRVTAPRPSARPTSPPPLRERHDTHHRHHDADDEGRTSEATADADAEHRARVAEDTRRDRPDQEYGALQAEACSRSSHLWTGSVAHPFRGCDTRSRSYRGSACRQRINNASWPVPSGSIAATSYDIGTEPCRCSCTTDSSSSPADDRTWSAAASPGR